MLFALDGKPIMDVVIGLHQFEEWIPCVSSFLAVHIRLHVSKHDETISRSRDKNVEPLACCKEANVAFPIASGQGHNDYVSLFPLVVIFESQQ